MNGDLHGVVDDRFEAVRDEFARNFTERHEVGASFAAYLDGRMIVDLWGGEASPGQPWPADALAPIASATKGANALVMQVLVDRGLVDLDSRVSRYWPEFGAAGKEAVTVRCLMSHQAGLPWFPEYWEVASTDDPAGFHDSEEIERRLAASEPIWAPGTRVGYHSLTIGWLTAGIVRRVTGTSIGAFFRSEIARPLELDLWIGLPEELHGRVVPLIPEPAPDPIAEALFSPDTDPGRALMIGRGRTPVVELLNDPKFWSAEVSAANGIASARALARMYAVLANDGQLDGTQLVSAKSIAAHSAEQSRGPDVVFSPMKARFGVGYLLQTRMVRWSPNDEAFGYPGFGGALGFADPRTGLAAGYVMNQSRPGMLIQPQCEALVGALYGALGEDAPGRT